MKEAAEVLGCSAQTVRPLIAAWSKTRGKTGIPHARIGKLIVTTRRDLAEFYESQKRLGRLDVV